MVDGLTALNDNGTWQLVPFLFDKSVVGYRWVFIVKYNRDGSVECFKALLVTKGYTPVDYAETYSPVANIASVQILISLSSNLGWPLFQV